jgi:hypothetical protein
MENKTVKSGTIKNMLDELAACGVCQTGKRYLKGTPCDLNTLIKVCKGWPEYLYEHSNYALPLFRKYLNESDKRILAGQSLYVDYKGQAEVNQSSRVFFMGDSKADLYTNDYAVSTIYLFNKSHVSLYPGNNSILVVEAFDDSNIDVMSGMNVKVTVYRHDRSKAVGVAKIISKEYKRGEVFNGREVGE